MRRKSSLFNTIVCLLGIALFPENSLSQNSPRGINDGLVHIGLYAGFSPSTNFIFSDYAEGTTGSNSITTGVAKFKSHSFSSYGAELMIFTQPAMGFSFGYIQDSPRDISHMDIEYSNGTATRTYKAQNDVFTNKSFTFNYFLRSPERSYLGFGVNYSNPEWTIQTPTNNKIELNGGLGFQVSYGFALFKGFVFDLSFRSSTLQMKYSDPTTNTFQDFGDGYIGAVSAGFKIIL